jgi:hypothetical protein
MLWRQRLICGGNLENLGPVSERQSHYFCDLVPGRS